MRWGGDWRCAEGGVMQRPIQNLSQKYFRRISSFKLPQSSDK